MQAKLLDELMSVAGQPPASGQVEFAGADPVFPTTFRFGEAGAATIAATAVQAARLWQMRSGRMQQVRVDVDHAAAAMRSTRYHKLELVPGKPDTGVVWNKRGNVGLG